MSEEPLIWDACGVLNLAATDRAPEILASLDRPCWIVGEVLAAEVLFLRPLPEEDPQGTLVPVDLSELIGARLLQEVTLTTDEEEFFVRFAQEVDDGEARTAAIAVSRGLHVATDDRAAIRLLRELPAAPPVVTTPDWLKAWADGEQVGREVLAEVLRRVELRARFRPRRMHPLYGWWNDNVQLR